MLPTTSTYDASQSFAGLQTSGLAQGTSSQMAATGIPNMDGQSYAYPPGSPMTTFIDDLNNRVSSATRGPDGMDVITWANGLVQQSQLRQQQQAELAQQQAATGDAASDPLQLLQMLLSMLVSQLQNLLGASA